MRLAKKHKKETDVIDQEMERFKALPDDYQTFVEETVFKDENYIFTIPTERKPIAQAASILSSWKISI